jgi:hypothetical protein
MSYQIDSGVVTLEELLDTKVADFIGQYYKEALAEPFGVWLKILGDNATPYANPKDMKILKGEHGEIQEQAMPYVLDLQYGIGANKLYEALQKAKEDLDKKIKGAPDKDMKESFMLQKAALEKTVGAYVEKAKSVGKFYATKYKAVMEFYKAQTIKSLEEQKNKELKPIESKIAAADGVLKSLG